MGLKELLNFMKTFGLNCSSIELLMFSGYMLRGTVYSGMSKKTNPKPFLSSILHEPEAISHQICHVAMD